MDYIKLKEKKDIFKLGIIDEDGNVVKDSNGKEVCIEFDLADIELPIRYNRCIREVETAKRNFKNQVIIINKKQDHKKKNRLSTNDELKAQAIKKLYQDMEKAMDLFLGEGGTKKFLNGRKPYIEMFDDIDEALKPFYPKMKLSITDMTDRIKNKYKIEESDVLTDE